MSSRGSAGCMAEIAGLLIGAMLCMGLYNFVGKWVFWPLVVLATFAFLRAIWRNARRGR